MPIAAVLDLLGLPAAAGAAWSMAPDGRGVRCGAGPRVRPGPPGLPEPARPGRTGQRGHRGDGRRPGSGSWPRGYFDPSPTRWPTPRSPRSVPGSRVLDVGAGPAAAGRLLAWRIVDDAAAAPRGRPRRLPRRRPGGPRGPIHGSARWWPMSGGRCRWPTRPWTWCSASSRPRNPAEFARVLRAGRTACSP